MSNMATGIPIGMVIGMGAGIATGKKQARETIEKNLRELLMTHTMDVRDPNGQSLSVDQLIHLVFKEPEMKKNSQIAIILAVLVLLLGIAAFLFFYLKH